MDSSSPFPYYHLTPVGEIGTNMSISAGKSVTGKEDRQREIPKRQSGTFQLKIGGSYGIAKGNIVKR